MGEMQKIHNSLGIKKETLLLLSLLGLVIGWISGLFLLTYKILLPSLVLLILLYFAYRNGKSGLISLLLPFLLSFIISSILNNLGYKDGYCEIKAVVISSKNNYFVVSNGLRRLYVYEKDCSREIGDIVFIKGYLSPHKFTEYESKFSFKDYLLRMGIRESVSVQSIENIFVRPFRVREKELRFLSNFSSLTSGTIDMIVFLRRDFKNENVALANQIGCLNVLSSSGIVFGLLLRALDKLFLLKTNEKKAKIYTFFSALFLFFFIGVKIGTYRVLIIRLLEMIALAKNRRSSYISNLSLSGIILFICNPYNSLNSGFLLGFGISYFMYFSRLYLHIFSKAESKIVSFLLLTVFLLPFFNIRGELILLGPLYSFLFTPIVTLFSFLTLISFLIVPYIGLLEGYSTFLNKTLIFIDKISLSVPLGEFPTASIFIYYLCIAIALYLADKGFSSLSKWPILVSCLSLLFPSLPITNSFLQEVSFINVGQGDSILIRDRGTNVLLDTGGNISFDMASDVLIPFFRKEKVYKIDCLIASHGDYDHIGAKESLQSKFCVKKVAENSNEFPLKIGNLTFYNLNVYGGEDENEKSLVLSLDFMGKNFLFMGDADTKIEGQIIKDNPSLKADVLKIGHHGSKTSSSYSFLNAVKPEVCIISVGAYNKYGHPNEEVIKRLEKLKIPYRRTDQEGTIAYRAYFRKPLGDLSQ